MGCHEVSADIGGKHLDHFAVMSKNMVSGFFSIKGSTDYLKDGPNHLTLVLLQMRNLEKKSSCFSKNETGSFLL